MRKFLLIFLSFFMIINSVSAQESVDAVIISCENSEEFVVSINDKIKRIRLYNFTRDDTDINRIIDEYTCKKVIDSKDLKVALTGNSDQYNYEYAIVYVENQDIREELISLGYGQVSNVESYSKELDNLCAIEKNAIVNKLGIWNYIEKEDFCQNNIVNKVENNDETPIKDETKKDNIYIPFLSLSTMLILILCLCIIKKRG